MEKRLIIDEYSDEFFDEIIYEIIVDKISVNVSSFKDEYLPQKSDKRKFLFSKQKFKLKESFMELASNAREELFSTNEEVVVYWLNSFSKSYNDDEDDYISSYPYIVIGKNDINEKLETEYIPFLENQQDFHIQNVDHIIIMGDLFEYEPIQNCILNHFRGQEIHHFKNEFLKDILCDVSETLQSTTDKKIVIVDEFN